MKLEKIFPINVRVPLFAIWFTDRLDATNCTGAKVLKRVLSKNNIPFGGVNWGRDSGNVLLEDDKIATIESSHNMMEVRPGTLVTLTLREII